MKKQCYILFCLLFAFSVWGQTGETAYTFLRYPSSARANAMGGNTVSLVEPDLSLAFHNPALLGGEMGGMVNLNYLNYIADVNVGSAAFAHTVGERGTWGVGASFFSQGKIQGMSVEGLPTGDFTAKDITIQGFYSYDLSEYWRGGASLKMLYSNIGDYSSMGVGVDVGLSYFNAEKELSFGFVLKNVGAQMKAYEDERQKMPWDIQLGVTKRLAYAPIRLTLTAQHLTTWKMNYVDDLTLEETSDAFFKTLVKHLTVGVDFIPSDNFWVALGYNPKRASDMKLQGGNALAGFSGGAGVRIKRFDVGFSVAKYHPSAISMMLSVATTIGGL